jgi:hypothetical protein
MSRCVTWRLVIAKSAVQTRRHVEARLAKSIGPEPFRCVNSIDRWCPALACRSVTGCARASN